YPMIARIALDVLPAQASSVPCKRLFSGSKQDATNRRARLGTERFEEMQIMKSAWRGDITDIVRLNSDKVEEVFDYQDYVGLLSDDVAMVEWDKFADAVILGII
ncbi:hypothetical protein BD779DRAFT_1454530, partial [Infundibulicybe gibba]